MKETEEETYRRWWQTEPHPAWFSVREETWKRSEERYERFPFLRDVDLTA
jgi:hypothetical protein